MVKSALRTAIDTSSDGLINQTFEPAIAMRFSYTKELSDKGPIYLPVYDEIFINGEKPTENSQFFHPNRIYLGLGYRTSSKLALQIGLMEQTSTFRSKTQLQFSAFHQLFSKK
nr:DUF2490 domain-containing protein [Algoriphagus alkaliphilus]